MADAEKKVSFHDFENLNRVLNHPEAMERPRIDDNFFIALPSLSFQQIAALGRHLNSLRTKSEDVEDEDPKAFRLENVLIRWYDQKEARGLAEWEAVGNKLKGLTGPIMYVSSFGEKKDNWENVDPQQYASQLRNLASFIHKSGIEAHFIGGLSDMHVFQIHPKGRVRERA